MIYDNVYEQKDLPCSILEMRLALLFMVLTKGEWERGGSAVECLT